MDHLSLSQDPPLVTDVMCPTSSITPPINLGRGDSGTAKIRDCRNGGRLSDSTHDKSCDADKSVGNPLIFDGTSPQDETSIFNVTTWFDPAVVSREYTHFPN